MIRCSRAFAFLKSLIAVLAILDVSQSFQTSSSTTTTRGVTRALHQNKNVYHPSPLRSQTPTDKLLSFALHRSKTKEEIEAETKDGASLNNAEETTEKYGLEAGLFQSIKSNDGESAKSLLAKYGVAYLATSIPLAIVSFAICYALVDNG